MLFETLWFNHLLLSQTSTVVKSLSLESCSKLSVSVPNRINKNPVVAGSCFSAVIGVDGPVILIKPKTKEVVLMLFHKIDLIFFFSNKTKKLLEACAKSHNKQASNGEWARQCSRLETKISTAFFLPPMILSRFLSTVKSRWETTWSFSRKKNWFTDRLIRIDSFDYKTRNGKMPPIPRPFFHKPHS